jgi:hypothetical protein
VNVCYSLGLDGEFLVSYLQGGGDSCPNITVLFHPNSNVLPWFHSNNSLDHTSKFLSVSQSAHYFVLFFFFFTVSSGSPQIPFLFFLFFFFFSIIFVLILEFWTQSKHLRSMYRVQPPAPKCQIKRHAEGRERRFITQFRTCHGRRQSKHSAHLQPCSGV